MFVCAPERHYPNFSDVFTLHFGSHFISHTSHHIYMHIPLLCAVPLYSDIQIHCKPFRLSFSNANFQCVRFLSLSFPDCFEQKLFGNRDGDHTKRDIQFLFYELCKHVRINWFYVRHSFIVLLSIQNFPFHDRYGVGMCERVNQKCCAFFVFESFDYSDSICEICAMFIDQSFLKLF